jgi:hypothetical protein
VSATTPTTEAARLCGELVTLLTCAREHAKSPDDFAQFHVGNLLNCAADHADTLYDLLLQAALPAIPAQQSSEGDAA